jgi:hypothetical protein
MIRPKATTSPSLMTAICSWSATYWMAMGVSVPAPGSSPVALKNTRKPGGWKYMPINAPLNNVTMNKGIKNNLYRPDSLAADTGSVLVRPVSFSGKSPEASDVMERLSSLLRATTISLFNNPTTSFQADKLRMGDPAPVGAPVLRRWVN